MLGTVLKRAATAAALVVAVSMARSCSTWWEWANMGAEERFVEACVSWMIATHPTEVVPQEARSRCEIVSALVRDLKP